ncbi:hypothetical protein M427DRAFT_67794 [Gonapodya prolifera JEL478]|uniref:Uncharacterized protein n=1 Tax=Gonapodya prolifera (strain JEL478) TaxID=1344416 RepID=A0A139ANP8_GONPJ|nr:hypothetical protein M427DRAFT_67794 [Gonapodya prolifera JEL478]|eukprot:KXS18362.1 hypothetical protein M427DRAFT_67794 [Gonapodya prolifera JEL478]
MHRNPPRSAGVTVRSSAIENSAAGGTGRAIVGVRNRRDGVAAGGAANTEKRPLPSTLHQRTKANPAISLAGDESVRENAPPRSAAPHRSPQATDKSLRTATLIKQLRTSPTLTKSVPSAVDRIRTNRTAVAPLRETSWSPATLNTAVKAKPREVGTTTLRADSSAGLLPRTVKTDDGKGQHRPPHTASQPLAKERLRRPEGLAAQPPPSTVRRPTHAMEPQSVARRPTTAISQAPSRLNAQRRERNGPGTSPPDVDVHRRVGDSHKSTEPAAPKMIISRSPVPNPPSSIRPPPTTPPPSIQPPSKVERPSTTQPSERYQQFPSEALVLPSLAHLLHTLNAPLPPAMRRDPRLIEVPSLRCELLEWATDRLVSVLSARPIAPQSMTSVGGDDAHTRLVARGNALANALALLGLSRPAPRFDSSQSLHASSLPPYISSARLFRSTLNRLLNLISTLSDRTRPNRDDGPMLRDLTTRTVLDGVLCETVDLLQGGIRVEVERKRARAMDGSGQLSRANLGLEERIQELKSDLSERQRICDTKQSQLMETRSKLPAAALSQLAQPSPASSQNVEIPLYLMPRPIPPRPHNSLAASRKLTSASTSLTRSLDTFVTLYTRHLAPPARRALAHRPPLVEEDECARELGASVERAWRGWTDVGKILDAVTALKESADALEDISKSGIVKELERKFGSDRIMRIMKRTEGVQSIARRNRG